jgi:branched-chain amino acid transport system substrate-binding protein
MKNQRISWFAFTLIAAMLVGGVIAAFAAPIRIGAILTLSGNAAAQGETMRDALLLAADEVNSKGGVNGNKIELIFEDSKLDPAVAVEAFNRMETSKVPLLYLANSSTICLALAPLAEEKRVILMGISTTAKEVTQARAWTFRYWPLGQAYIPVLSRILQNLKLKKIGMLYQNDPFGKEQQQLLSKEFEAMGGQIASVLVEMTATDFRPQIAQMKDREAIYIACSGTLLTGILKQLKEQNYQGKILSSGFSYQTSLFGLPEAQGVYLTAPVIYNPNYLYARELADKFLAKYKKGIDAAGSVGYDLVRLFAGLLEDREVSRQGLRNVLDAGFDYSGVFGSVRLKPGEHDLTFPIYPVQVVNGSLKY